MLLMSSRVHQAVLTSYPRDDVGHHCPGNLSISIGWHDIFDCVENDEGHFFGRASLSISFWGAYVPTNLDLYRRTFFELPDVCEVRRLIESVIGVTEICILLSV
jgi:hypothetical protein